MARVSVEGVRLSYTTCSFRCDPTRLQNLASIRDVGFRSLWYFSQVLASSNPLRLQCCMSSFFGQLGECHSRLSSIHGRRILRTRQVGIKYEGGLHVPVPLFLPWLSFLKLLSFPRGFSVRDYVYSETSPRSLLSCSVQETVLWNWRTLGTEALYRSGVVLLHLAATSYSNHYRR